MTHHQPPSNHTKNGARSHHATTSLPGSAPSNFATGSVHPNVRAISSARCPIVFAGNSSRSSSIAIPLAVSIPIAL